MTTFTDPDSLSQGTSNSIALTTFATLATNTITITSVNILAANYVAGRYIEVRDAVDTDNDGLYIIDSVINATSMTCTKQALTGAVVPPAVDAGSQTIRIFGDEAIQKNVHFDTTNLKWTFLNGFGIGFGASPDTVLTNDGATGQTIYSFFKEEWKNDDDLIKFPFPMTAITPEQFEFNEWLPVDESESTISTTEPSNTRQLIRSAGWSEVNAAGIVTDSHFGWVTLGNIDAGDNAYYFFSGRAAATSAVFDGAVNEAVQSIFGNTAASVGDISFATTSTITRTVGSWVSDGYLVGDKILVQGAAVAGNNGSFVITDVVALTITVTGTPLTVQSPLVDSAARVALDLRANVFTTRIRTFGKSYDQSTSTAIGVTTLTNQVYRFPLSEAADPVITDLVVSDAISPATVANLFANIITVPIAPYDDMTIRYYDDAQLRSGFNLGGILSPGSTGEFGVIIDGDVSVTQQDGGGSASAEQIYAFVQARLSTAVDINDGAGSPGISVIGQLAEPLLVLGSTGNTLSSLAQTTNPGEEEASPTAGTGVYVDSFAGADKNRVSFVDNSGAARTFPLTVAITIAFNSNLANDVDAVYRNFFTNDDAGDNTGRDFGTINAILVQDDTLTDVSGAVPQAGVPGDPSSTTFNYAYDANVQRGGASASTDAPITLVSLGLNSAQYVVATGTITSQAAQTFSLVAALERNFSNP